MDEADNLHENFRWQHAEELVDVGVAVYFGEDEALAGVAEVGVRSCHVKISTVKVRMAVFAVSTRVRAITSTCKSRSTPVLFVLTDVDLVDLGVNVGVAEVAGDVLWAGHLLCCVGREKYLLVNHKKVFQFF